MNYKFKICVFSVYR